MPRPDIDEAGAEELELYIENDGDLHRQQHQPIIKALMAKRARGEYDEARAIDAFMNLVESGAKKYHQEHGTPGRPWHDAFSVATRRVVAQNLAKTFEAEAGLGNYDQLLPKKYQPEPAISGPPPGAGRGARKTGAQLDREVDAYLADAAPRKAKNAKRTRR